MAEKNLTDNAWIKRVGELRQMVSDLPSAPDTIDDVKFYLESEEFFGSDKFDGADRKFLRKEMVVRYNVV